MITISERREHESAKSFVLRVLIDNIINTRLEPGEKLNEPELCEQLGVSRTPFREAELELAQRRLIEIRPKIGTYVSLIDAELVEEVRHLRAVLEAEIARMACEKLTPADIDQLWENVALWRMYIERAQEEKIFELDKGFHRLLYVQCGCPYWYDLVENLAPHFDRTTILSFRCRPAKTIYSPLPPPSSLPIPIFIPSSIPLQSFPFHIPITPFPQTSHFPPNPPHKPLHPPPLHPNSHPLHHIPPYSSKKNIPLKKSLPLQSLSPSHNTQTHPHPTHPTSLHTPNLTPFSPPSPPPPLILTPTPNPLSFILFPLPQSPPSHKLLTPNLQSLSFTPTPTLINPPLSTIPPTSYISLPSKSPPPIPHPTPPIIILPPHHSLFLFSSPNPTPPSSSLIIISPPPSYHSLILLPHSSFLS